MSCVIQFSRYGRYLLQIAIFLPFCAILWIIQKRFREKTSFLTSKARPRGHSRPLSSTNSVIWNTWLVMWQTDGQTQTDSIALSVALCWRAIKKSLMPDSHRRLDETVEFCRVDGVHWVGASVCDIFQFRGLLIDDVTAVSEVLPAGQKKILSCWAEADNMQHEL